MYLICISLSVPLSVSAFCFVCIGVSVSLGMVLLVPSSTALSACSSSVCSPASLQFFSLQCFYPGSSRTHRWIVESTSVNFWTITHLPACLPALQPTTTCFLMPALLPHSSQPSSPLPHSASSLCHLLPFPTLLAMKLASFISTLVCVWVLGCPSLITTYSRTQHDLSMCL